MTGQTKYGTDHGKINVEYYDHIRDMDELGRKYVADKLGGVFCENIKIPGTAVNPPGQVSDPDVEATSGLLLFDSGTTELIFAMVQMPHKWFMETEISPHIHWEKTTSAVGNVAWRLRYKHAPVGGLRDAVWTDLGIVTDLSPETPDPDTADHQLVTRFPSIDMTGKELEHSLLFELSRVGGDASDTYVADARLLAMDIHFFIDAPGGFRPDIKQTY